MQWIDAKSCSHCAQSIAEVLAPTCFQNEFEAPVFEHVFQCVSDQCIFQNMLELKNTFKTCSKQGSHFENMVWGLTHTYKNRVFIVCVPA